MKAEFFLYGNYLFGKHLVSNQVPFSGNQKFRNLAVTKKFFATWRNETRLNFYTKQNGGQTLLFFV